MSAPVYAELLAHPRVDVEFLDRFLLQHTIAVDFDLGEAIWREAGTRFARYADRRRKSKGGLARRFLADFLIGSHALHRADRLFTFDANRYANDFPELEIVGLKS